MSPLSWRKWFRSRARASAPQGAAGKTTRPTRCLLEILEDRTLPANFVVTLPGDAGIGANGTTADGQLAGDIRYVINQADLLVNKGSTITFSGSAGTTIALNTSPTPFPSN